MEDRDPRIPDLHEMLQAGDPEALRQFFDETHPAIVAEMVSQLPEREAWAALRHADPAARAEIFSHLEEGFQVGIVESLQRQDIARLLEDMPPDDRADLFKQLPEGVRGAVLPALAQAEREDIRRLASYEEGTAGSVMTSDYATLSPQLTASEAIERLREVAPDKETIYYAYVVDEQRRLLGFLSLRDLILARRNECVEDIMHRDVIVARVDEDQEAAARMIQKFDLLALPVINGGDALVGIITHDDALDVITQEQTEDMEKIMAIAGTHEAGVYLKTSSWVHFRNRANWVVVLAILGMASGFIVQRFEGLLIQLAILAAFMPMLADTGGNTGSQAATLVVRALALKEVRPRDALRIVAKEFQVALMLALLLGMLAFGRVILIGHGATIPEGQSLALIGIAIATALGLQVITATVVGALLPLGAASLDLDPAVVASPALTTVVDITGLLIYFTTVSLILGI